MSPTGALCAVQGTQGSHCGHARAARGAVPAKSIFGVCFSRVGRVGGGGVSGAGTSNQSIPGPAAIISVNGNTPRAVPVRFGTCLGAQSSLFALIERAASEHFRRSFGPNLAVLELDRLAARRRLAFGSDAAAPRATTTRRPSTPDRSPLRGSDRWADPRHAKMSDRPPAVRSLVGACPPQAGLQRFAKVAARARVRPTCAGPRPRTRHQRGSRMGGT